MKQELIELLPTLPLIENPEDINESTRLEEDLRLFGFQARTFLLRYADTFSVDITRFHFRKYFSKDASYIKIYRNLIRRRKNILTMGDLDGAIAYGKLNEAVLKHIAENTPVKPPRRRIFLKTQSHYKPKDILISTLIVILAAALLSVVAFYF